MLKKYDEALNNMREGSQFPDSARGSDVFKVLKDEDYDGRTKDGSKGQPSKRKFRKGRKSTTCTTKSDEENEEKFEHHETLLLNERLPSKEFNHNHMKDLDKGKDNVVESSPDTDTAVEETITADEEPTEETTTDDGEIVRVLTKSHAQDKFRDGLRRIDIVLVAEDDGDLLVTEERNRYLHSILKTGLEIETSPGVMSMNRNLVFIKIHAPDSVLDEYNLAFGTKKYFRDDHLRFVKPGLTKYGLLLPCTRVTHERELISLVRDQYNEPMRLSNAERSLIVYKILLEQPGNCADNFGLDRLLSRRMFLDLFALHDGPYFIFPNQDWRTISARQLLFYNWVGKGNAYKVHPLNLIREYFGERIGMFFAFYEFFNHALIIASIFGVFFYYQAVNDTTDSFVVNDICKNKNNSYICPRCNVFEACRFIKLTDLCKLAKIHKVLDSPITFYYAIFLTVWASTFYVLWRRKESFWIWLWEINTDRTKETYKPEYIFDHKVQLRSKRTGLLQNYVRGAEKEVRTFLIVVLWIVLFAVPIVMVVPLFMHKQHTDITLIKHKVVSLSNEEIAFVVIFAIQLVFIQILAELIYRVPVYYITKFLENHSTYESQARSFMFKTFAASFLWTFPIMFYYAWMKGAEFYTPVRPEAKRKSRLFAQFRGHYSFTHCGPFTCLDEVFFVLLATIFIKHMTIPFLMFLKGLIYNTQTEYNQGARVTKNVPLWEREFRLEPVTEAMMARKFNVLTMQFALVTLVGAVFPLAPLLILIRNFCDIRYEARMFVQFRRRPLLLGTGLGVWTPILHRLVFFSAPANALTLARATKTVARKIYMDKIGKESMKGYLFYSLYLADTNMYAEYLKDTRYGMKVMWDYYNDYRKKNFVPEKCYFPGLFKAYDYGEYDDPKPIYFKPEHLATKPEYYIVGFEAHMLYFVFSMVGLLYAVILSCVVPPYSSQLTTIMEIETRMKNAYIRISKK